MCGIPLAKSRGGAIKVQHAWQWQKISWISHRHDWISYYNPVASLLERLTGVVCKVHRVFPFNGGHIPKHTPYHAIIVIMHISPRIRMIIEASYRKKWSNKMKSQVVMQFKFYFVNDDAALKPTCNHFSKLTRQKWYVNTCENASTI